MAIVAPAIFHPKFFILIFNIIINFSMTCSMSEAEALLSLKNSFSNSEALDNWIANTFPCTEDDKWAGVVCYNGLVTGLRLGGRGLFGKIDVDALLELKGLRTISLMNNSFTGSIPELNRIGFLKAMYLSGNKFSGNIPQEYFQSMKSLKKVWLSNNEFTGVIPSSLAEVPQLVELHLENNQFSGNIPNFNSPSLRKIDVSNNNLEGEVPEGLMRFNQSSFQGNSGLCGEKIGTICGKPMEQPNPIGAHNMNNMTELKNNNDNVYVSMADKSKHRSLQIIGIVVTSIVLISLAIFLIMKSRKKKEKVEYDDEIGENNGQESINDIGSVEVQVTSSSNSISTSTNHVKKSPSSRKNSSHGSKGMGELMMMNDDKGVFGLPDLMKASAEVLGNGGFGSSYKAVMSNGLAVVVKRTRELNGLGKDGFEAEMKRLGRVKHWNVLTPLAYHYRKDEKLVISEYVPRGSLLYLLHGDRGPSHAELDWNTRLKIVQGIAKGMHYLHTELASSDLPHGNLKSSNVLLGPDYEPFLMDFGFINLVHPSSYAQTLFAYKAPEALQHSKVSPRCDVYCLGVVILEILTGKFPSQYLNNGKGGTDVVQWVASAICEGREVELLDPEIASNKKSLSEMQQLIHIGAACTESNPKKRLDMFEAIRRIEGIKTKGVHFQDQVQESRTIEVLPSLRDGFGDSSQAYDNQGHFGDESRRRHGTSSIGNKDNIEFGVA
ncbi:pollen receptor kinase [Trifolium repens]|nr:pollen receptor kinase [Trifolium repens]